MRSCKEQKYLKAVTSSDNDEFLVDNDDYYDDDELPEKDLSSNRLRLCFSVPSIALFYRDGESEYISYV